MHSPVVAEKNAKFFSWTISHHHEVGRALEYEYSTCAMATTRPSGEREIWLGWLLSQGYDPVTSTSASWPLLNSMAVLNTFQLPSLLTFTIHRTKANVKTRICSPLPFSHCLHWRQSCTLHSDDLRGMLEPLNFFHTPHLSSQMLWLPFQSLHCEKISPPRLSRLEWIQKWQQTF